MGPRSALKNNGFNFKDKSKPKVPSSNHFTLKVGHSEAQKICQGLFLISTERLWALDLTSVQWSKVKLRRVIYSLSHHPNHRKHKTNTKHTHTHTDKCPSSKGQNQLRNAKKVGELCKSSNLGRLLTLHFPPQRDS